MTSVSTETSSRSELFKAEAKAGKTQEQREEGAGHCVKRMVRMRSMGQASQRGGVRVLLEIDWEVAGKKENKDKMACTFLIHKVGREPGNWKPQPRLIRVLRTISIELLVEAIRRRAGELVRKRLSLEIDDGTKTFWRRLFQSSKTGNGGGSMTCIAIERQSIAQSAAN